MSTVALAKRRTFNERMRVAMRVAETWGQRWQGVRAWVLSTAALRWGRSASPILLQSSLTAGGHRTGMYLAYRERVKAALAVLRFHCVIV